MYNSNSISLVSNRSLTDVYLYYNVVCSDYNLSRKLIFHIIKQETQSTQQATIINWSIKNWLMCSLSIYHRNTNRATLFVHMRQKIPIYAHHSLRIPHSGKAMQQPLITHNPVHLPDPPGQIPGIPCRFLCANLDTQLKNPVR